MTSGDETLHVVASLQGARLKIERALETLSPGITDPAPPTRLIEQVVRLCDAAETLIEGAGDIQVGEFGPGREIWPRDYDRLKTELAQTRTVLRDALTPHLTEGK